MTYFFHPNPIRDMLIANRRLKEVDDEIVELELTIAKRKVDREHLSVYIRNHKRIR